MAKGRYIKSAERACAGKARFDTADEALAHADYRFRTYVCPVCHSYHLTSKGSGISASPPGPTPTPVKRPDGPKLGDLDWSSILDPTPKEPKRPPSSDSYRPPTKPTKPVRPPTHEATVVSVGKDRRAHLLVDGALVKSRPIKDGRLLERLKPQGKVFTDGAAHPTILGLLS